MLACNQCRSDDGPLGLPYSASAFQCQLSWVPSVLSFIRVCFVASDPLFLCQLLLDRVVGSLEVYPTAPVIQRNPLFKWGLALWGEMSLGGPFCCTDVDSMSHSRFWTYQLLLEES